MKEHIARTNYLLEISPLKALLKLSLPLMMVSFSSIFMLTCDRIILAHLSIQAMSAVVMAGMVFSLFSYSFMSITTIAEAFVGQKNGAQEWKTLGDPVWQMIFFSLGTALLFWPLAFIGSAWFLPAAMIEEGAPFLKTLFWAGPLFPLHGALSAFYIGQGKTKLITVVTIGCSLLNILLNYFFVFGIEGMVPALGTQGSALGTSISELLIVVILFFDFISPKNKIRFNTHQCAFNSTSFFIYLKKGLPCGVSRAIEFIAWILALEIVSLISNTHMVLTSVAQNYWIMFIFVAEGLNKGVIALSSNFIGSNQRARIHEVFIASIKICLGSSLLMLIPFFLLAKPLALLYVTENETTWLPLLIQAGHWVWLGFLFELLIWAFNGLLISFGDTRFIMFLMTVSSWVFGLLPIVLFVYLPSGPPLLIPQLWCVYAALTALCFYLRYQHQKIQAD